LQAGHLICRSTMAWEKRGNGSYYYSKQREGSRVRSVYVGRSEAALLISCENRVHRQQCEEMRASTSAEREVSRSIDEELEKLHAACDALTAATLLTAGFHTHNRQWRKKRGG
jgi:hypothetical protein